MFMNLFREFVPRSLQPRVLYLYITSHIYLYVSETGSIVENKKRQQQVYGSTRYGRRYESLPPSKRQAALWRSPPPQQWQAPRSPRGRSPSRAFHRWQVAGSLQRKMQAEETQVQAGRGLYPGAEGAGRPVPGMHPSQKSRNPVLQAGGAGRTPSSI